MPNAKNAQSPVDDSALLAALSEPAVPKPVKPTPAAPAKPSPIPAAPDPAADPSRLAVVDEDPTVAERIKALIEALGFEIDEVAAVEIRRPGIIRILGRDRGLASRRFEWPKIWEKAE